MSTLWNAIAIPKVNGYAGIVRQQMKWGRNETGYYTIQPFEGPFKAIWSLRQLYNGVMHEMTELNGGRARLEFRVSYDLTSQVAGTAESPENLWELLTKTADKDVVQADFPFALTSAFGVGPISQANRIIIEQNLSNIGPSPTFVSDGTQTSADTLWQLICAGVRSFPVDAPVIRHTQMVSNIYAVKVSYFNVRRIMSAATFVSLEQVPNDLLFAVPPDLTSSQFVKFPGDLIYGWLKLRPEVTRMAYLKWRITQEYEYGLYPASLSGARL